MLLLCWCDPKAVTRRKRTVAQLTHGPVYTHAHPNKHTLTLDHVKKTHLGNDICLCVFFQWFGLSFLRLWPQMSVHSSSITCFWRKLHNSHKTAEYHAALCSIREYSYSCNVGVGPAAGVYGAALEYFMWILIDQPIIRLYWGESHPHNKEPQHGKISLWC